MSRIPIDGRIVLILLQIILVEMAGTRFHGAPGHPVPGGISPHVRRFHPVPLISRVRPNALTPNLWASTPTSPENIVRTGDEIEIENAARVGLQLGALHQVHILDAARVQTWPSEVQAAHIHDAIRRIIDGNPAAFRT